MNDIEPVLAVIDEELAKTVVEPESEVRTWTIVTLDGEFMSKCPFCGEYDEIREVDRAIRWNYLRFENTRGAVATISGDSDWEGDGWVCAACGADDLVAPPNFEITDWN